MLIFLCIYVFISLAVGFHHQGPTFIRRRLHSSSNDLYSSNHPISSDADDRRDIRATFMDQKNYLLLEKLSEPPNGNLTAAAIQYVNLCDESFDSFLSDRMTNAKSEIERQYLGKIRYEVNIARRYKLVDADRILRTILEAGGLKQMEAKLSYYLARSDIDMAFMVMLQLNIENAMQHNVTTAVRVMKHLETLITEYQDRYVNPPVRLLRMLLRADDPVTRKQMLRQKLLYKTSSGEVLSSGQIEARVRGTASPPDTTTTASAETTDRKTTDEMLPTPSAQCENILVSAVKSWGEADVKFEELDETISDVLSQVSTLEFMPYATRC
jgi:hypothetical protein